MKRIINENIPKLEIVVEVFHDVDTRSIEAATIRPIYDPNGEIDDFALGEYYAFLDQTECYLEDEGLEIIDYQESKASKTSFYYTLADAEQYKSGNMKFIIYLRVSDHRSKLRPEQSKLLKQKHRDEASRLRVRYKLRQILVNSDEFVTYDQACDEVVEKAKEFKEALK